MKNPTHFARRQFIKVSALTSVGIISGKTNRLPAQKKKPPNIIFLMADDHKAGIMGCAGYKPIKTPHMDKLAALRRLISRIMSLIRKIRSSIRTKIYQHREISKKNTWINYQFRLNWEGSIFSVLNGMMIIFRIT